MESFSVGDSVIFESPDGCKIEATIEALTPGVNEPGCIRNPMATIMGKRISGSIQVPLMYLRK